MWVAGLLAVLAARADAAVTTSHIPDPAAALAIAETNGGAVRLMAEARIGGGNNDWELGLRRHPLILNDGTLVTADFNGWPNGVPVPFVLSYDGQRTVTMTLPRTTVANGPAFVVAGDFNEILIPTRAADDRTSIVVDALTLDGQPVAGASSAVSSGTETQDVLRIQGASLAKGFVLAGTLTLRWKGGRPAGSRLDAQVWLAKVNSAGPDGDPPQLTITSPENFLVTDSSSPPVMVTYQDQGSGIAAETLKLFLDEVEQPGACTAGAASATCRTSGLAQGTHMARVTVADRNGNATKAVSIFTVAIDHDPPTLAVEAPVPGNLVGGPAQEIRLSYADALSGVDLRTMAITLDGGNLVPGCLLNSDSASCKVSSLAPGPHVLRASLRDFARNSAAAEVAFTFALERTPPRIAVFEPAGTRLINQPPSRLLVTYSDEDSGIDPGSVKVSLDGTDLTSACQVDRGMITCPLQALADGSHHVAASVADHAGNRAATASDFITATDREPPAIVLTSPAEGAIVGSSPVHLTGTVSDDSGVEILLVGGREAVIGPGGGFAADLEVQPGSNSFNVIAVDAVGRQTMVTRTIYFDATPPGVHILSPAAASTVNGDRITIRGYATDQHPLGAVTANGVPATVAGSLFTVQVPLAEGANHVEVRVRDSAGNEGTASLEVTRFSVPEVEITSPLADAVFQESVIDVRGRVGPGVSTVAVNGRAASVSGGTFVATGVPLAEGLNALSAVAFGSSGRQGITSVGVFRDSTAPRLFVDSPADGELVRELMITVRGRVIDLVSGIGDAGAIGVTVNGTAATVAGGTFLARVPAGADVTPLIVQAADGAGNLVEARLSVRYAAPRGARIEIVSGNGQLAPAGAPLPLPLVVRLTDAGGQPVANRAVIFKVTGNDGVLNGGRRRVSVITGADGQASVQLTAGTRAGMGTQVVEAEAAGVEAPAVFLADAQPALFRRTLVDMGDQQVGVAGQPLPDPLVAVVADDFLNRVSGARVLFRVVSGGGHLANGLAEMTVETDAQGRAATPFILGEESGTANQIVEAVLADAVGAPAASFTASGWSAGDPAGTAVSGVVLDNTDAPVPGATVRIADTPFTTQTDSRGQFKIAGAPSGYARLIVEGSSTTRPGSWPALDFQLNLVPGRDNTMGRPIYLLPIDEAHGRFIDETHGGTLTVPDVPGFSLEIAPGSVTFPGGSRSGVVSVTVVHADKVPMAPSMGIQPRLVVTIQPPGARFDPPARMTFPNAAGLKPGETTEVFSFDHEMVRFVSIGTATVSEDGSLLAGDPGTGIVQAGWHWPCGGSTGASGTAHNCKQCLKCESARCVPDLEQEGDRCDDENICTIEDECTGEDRRCLGYAPDFKKVVVRADGQDDASVRGVGDEFTFTAAPEGASCPGGALKYEWNFGDGMKSTEASPRHKYTSVGLYQVIVKLACARCPVTQGYGSVFAVAAEVNIGGADGTGNQFVSRDNPLSAWESPERLTPGKPLYANKNSGDWVKYTVEVRPRYAALYRLTSLEWKAEGPETHSGPSGKDKDEWKIEKGGIDWSPEKYTIKAIGHFKGGTTVEGTWEQEVGRRTEEYFVVNSLLAALPEPTEGVASTTIDQYECPEIVFRLTRGSIADGFNDPHSFAYVRENYADRRYVVYRIFNSTANEDPASAIDPTASATSFFGLIDYRHFRHFSRAQFKYLVHNGVLDTQPRAVGNLVDAIGQTPAPCFGAMTAPYFGNFAGPYGDRSPDSGRVTANLGEAQFSFVMKSRAGGFGQEGWKSLLRRDLAWVFFRYRFNAKTGELESNLSAPSYAPDGPDDKDFSTVPTIFVYHRYFDPNASAMKVELVRRIPELVEDFMSVGPIIGFPHYP